LIFPENQKQMSRGIDGKVAVVTGAAKGIGQRYAKRLAEEGADIAVADVVSPEETQALVRQAGRECLVYQCDVSAETEVAAFAGAALQRFGHVDIVINNAGIYPVAPFVEMSFADWRKVLSVNLDSAFLMCHAFVPGMRDREWGRIVNISSGTVLKPPPTMAHYVASKAGIIGFTRALAAEVGQWGITVNAIAPGLTATQTVLEGPQGEWLDNRVSIQAIRRVEQPDDLAGTVAFLASEDAAFVTGQTILVNGGASFL
jgi:(S)-1-phenylethanol dehydrogenase